MSLTVSCSPINLLLPTRKRQHFYFLFDTFNNNNKSVERDAIFLLGLKSHLVRLTNNICER
ncbi:Uncharacterized protein APZ42_034070 [Daphnia magna]|uniref:Uncharacterized protein n=1 Tax=Daphnia magna TaxID=35525 RepID=A0A0P5XX44_9CRUS|nr:Uncharacterized protein APZ42_034070 [Daphnia magna]